MKYPINQKSPSQIKSFILLCILCLFVQLTSLSAQNTEDTAKRKVSDFLTSCKGFQNYSATGFTAEFTGEYQPIPDDIHSNLNRYFPQNDFYVAKMSVLIDAPQKSSNLLLVTDKDSAEIKGFLWGNYRTLHPSDSFASIFRDQQSTSKDEVLEKIQSLAQIIAFAGNVSVGKARIKNNEAVVELIRQEGVSAILKAKMNKHLQFKYLRITETDGSPLKYFVSKKYSC